MDGFIRWCRRYYTEITWFIIGWLTLDMIFEFSRGNWPGVVFDIILITLNYQLNKR